MRTPATPPFVPSWAPVVVGLGAAALGFGYTAWMYHRAQPLPTVQPAMPPPGLENWEWDAELGGDVEDIGEDIGEIPTDLPLVGTGSPSELCAPTPDLDTGGEWGIVCVADPLNDPTFAPRPSASPFARAVSASTWPTQNSSKPHSLRLVVSYWTEDGLRGKWGRYFGAKRSGKEGARHHAGLDVFANAGDVVVSPVAGRVIAALPFTKGTWAVYVRTQDDVVINLGELQRLSWREFGVKPGSELRRGDPVGRVGIQTGGSQMLHYEMYDARGLSDEEIVKEIRRGAFKWPYGQEPPERLYDPTAFLVDAAARTYRSEQPVV